MWNKHDILSNDIASKFEDRMFCNFGGGGTPGDIGGGQGGYGPDTGAGLDAFGGAGASVADITSGRTTVAGERIGGGDDSGNGGSSESTAQMRQRIQAERAVQEQLARDQAQTAINESIRQRLANENLPQNIAQGYGQGSSPVTQLFSRQLNQPLPNIGLMGVGFNTLGQNIAKGIATRLGQGGTPVYDPTGQIVGVMGQGLFGGEAYFGRPGFDPLQGGSQRIEDETGALMGYQSRGYTGDMGDDDDGGPDIPRAPVTAITPAEEPVAAAVTPQYMQPAGGFYPSQGLYYRRGLLDEPVPGLLDFTARNRAFRRGMATDASLYQMPYDLTGYTLL